MGHEEKLIYQLCILNSYKYCFFDFDSLSSKEAQLDDCSLVVGSVEALICAMNQLGIPVPVSNYYPEQLTEFLYRSVWKGKPADVWHRVLNDKPVFAKSAKWKLLSGQIFDQSSGTQALSSLEKNEDLFLSEPVNWLSEYRVYVLNNQILAICNYYGDSNVAPDRNVISLAVTKMQTLASTPAAYAIDWGVLDSGETALIEMGDAWATGAYEGINPKDYFHFLKVRWDELKLSR